MKLKVVSFLGLACASAAAQAFNNFVPLSDSVTINGVKFETGLDDDNNCGFRRTEGTTETDFQLVSSDPANTAGCDPQSIVQVGNDVWVLIKTDANIDLLDAANFLTGSSPNEVLSLTNAQAAASTEVLAVVRINTADGADFGKLTGGSYLGTSDGTNFDGFTATAVDICNGEMRITGDTPTGFAIVDQNEAPIAGAEGTGIYLNYNTANGAVTYSATLEECEEEEEEENSAGALSALSALLAVVGVVAL